jgi:hypothetical protein
MSDSPNTMNVANLQILFTMMPTPEPVSPSEPSSTTPVPVKTTYNFFKSRLPSVKSPPDDDDVWDGYI